jgi:hypothetical protein
VLRHVSRLFEGVLKLQPVAVTFNGLVPKGAVPNRSTAASARTRT